MLICVSPHTHLQNLGVEDDVYAVHVRVPQLQACVATSQETVCISAKSRRIREFPAPTPTRLQRTVQFVLNLAQGIGHQGLRIGAKLVEEPLDVVVGEDLRQSVSYKLDNI